MINLTEFSWFRSTFFTFKTCFIMNDNVFSTARHWAKSNFFHYESEMIVRSLSVHVYFWWCKQFFCSRFASPDLCKCLSAIGNPNHLFVDHVCEIHAIKESIYFYFLGIGNHCVGNNKYISPLLSSLLLYIREWPHWVMKMVGRWLG